MNTVAKNTPKTKAGKGKSPTGRAVTSHKAVARKVSDKSSVHPTIPGNNPDQRASQGYIAKLDSKKRITVREALSEYYTVVPMESGIIVLKPQQEFRLDDLPPEVLSMIDASAANFRAGRVYGPIDLD